jgi:myo-inositol-1(or 4)-monophosphatase
VARHRAVALLTRDAGAGRPRAMLHSALLNVIIAAARKAGRALKRDFGEIEKLQVSLKGPGNFVSAADRRAEETLYVELSKARPGYGFLGEEGGVREGADKTHTWIVDPLDGTTNFVHGIPQFAVSIGVAIDGRVDFGVIFDPCKNDVFTAARGRGAHWNGVPCHVSSHQRLEGSLLATGFPFKAHRLLGPYLAIFRDVFLSCKAIRRPGAAALDLAYTAAGMFDGFFEFQLSAWDTAAGALLIEEAGGVITDMEGGADHLESGNVVSGTPGVHRELLETIQIHGDDWRAALKQE